MTSSTAVIALLLSLSSTPNVVVTSFTTQRVTTFSLSHSTLSSDSFRRHHQQRPLHLVDPSTPFPSFTTLLLSDETATALADAATAAADTATAAASTDSGNGWFGFLAGPIEGLLQIIHAALMGVGLSENSWGVSIIAMTVVIKLVTYPLTKNQLESTTKMQAVQPKMKAIQSTYQSNPEVMNQKISELYQNEGVNPLAGCLPAIVQLPVFIGLYRAVLELAKENKLDESFLWLPSLEGPVYGADPSHAGDWIMKGWNGLTPSLGWPDTIAFLTLPVLLIISQLISQNLMQPKNPDGSTPETNAVLKFLPFMIGYFSLNVPSALGIYWVINNVVTTAISLQIRASLEASGAGAVSVEVPATSVDAGRFIPSPAREKPSGFGSVEGGDDMKVITAPIDAEVVTATVEEGGEGEVQEVAATTTTPKKKRGGKKKKKKRSN